ncbi:MAG: glycogen/starch synthase [Dysgonamonadaceae bacterium]|jgi:glycogen synthase|nr:glycogen/starch synthase [Dysgonamonadaceae bacterium]
MAHLHRSVPDYVFEASWEVCNKVGGIYTVLSTRAKTLQTYFDDKLIFIGPDLWKEKENTEFIENKSVLKAWRKHAAGKENLSVRTGYWNIPGKPVVILVDFTPFFEKKEAVYYWMWEKYRIDSTPAYGDYDEACLFAYATGLVIESVYSFFQLREKKVVAHLNEWMLGMALLYLHGKVPGIATVFTTHATSIGRSICGNDKPLYGEFANYDGDQMAGELNMTGKHFLEKQAAHYADCFTTVSEITGRECEQLLGKKPDIITPNGFEPRFVPNEKTFAAKREAARKAFITVAEQLTGASIPDHAFLLATSGRYEYKNKGIDVFIESMHRIKQAHPKRFILAFILVPAWINGPRKDLQERLEQKLPAAAPLPSPFVTHELVDPYSDSVCRYLYHLNFMNQDNDNMKIIFVPSYLNGNDGIFNKSYYDLLTGLDGTVFPSYYEPWGYTPLESIAFHVPTITTNLAGFGVWAEQETTGNALSGVKVLERTEDNYFEVAEEIKDTILQHSEKFGPEQTERLRKAAFALSEKASWSYFIRYYLDAYEIAITKKQKK